MTLRIETHHFFKLKILLNLFILHKFRNLISFGIESSKLLGGVVQLIFKKLLRNIPNLFVLRACEEYILIGELFQNILLFILFFFKNLD